MVWGPLATLVERKYYMDELYEDVIVRRGLYGFACGVLEWVDTNIIDAAVNGSGVATRRAGDALRWVQSGSVQAYGSVGFAGLVVVTVVMLVFMET
jgi:NADH:ubiquinone oxidoreductase subunit 5 (subunit L)/multisubunit Na+/H+ antiporter MnhA subunit